MDVAGVEIAFVDRDDDCQFTAAGMAMLNDSGARLQIATAVDTVE